MRHRFLAVVSVLSIALAACGGDDDATSNAANTEGPTASGASGQDDAPADPNGVARLGYDLIGASHGGFSFDPKAAATNTSDLGVYHWVYGALMRPTADGLVPGLAKSAEVVDNKTIEVVLRDGVTFSDGTPLTPEIVKASYDRNLQEPHSSAFRTSFYSLESVEVTGPGSVTLHIPDGTAPSWFDLYLGSFGSVILPPDFDPEAPVGAGPFVVTEYAPEQRMVLEKNPDYWNADAIQLAGVELVNTPDAQTAATALQAGQIDFGRLDYSNIDAVGSDIDLLIEPNENQLTQIQMCKSQEPFDDPRVRQALSYAIDAEAINNALFDGEGEVASDLWPDDHMYHNDELTGYYAYDPDKARELLAEAGLADGFSFDIIPLKASNVPEIVQIAQQQWAEIGVTANIVNSSNFAEDFYISNRAPVAVIPVTAKGPGRLDQLTPGILNNVCEYDNPALNELMHELRTVGASSDEAVSIWAEIQDIVVKEALVLLPLFQPEVHAYDGGRLGDVAVAEYTIPVPDIWNLYVKA